MFFFYKLLLALVIYCTFYRTIAKENIYIYIFSLNITDVERVYQGEDIYGVIRNLQH